MLKNINMAAIPNVWLRERIFVYRQILIYILFWVEVISAACSESDSSYYFPLSLLGLLT